MDRATGIKMVKKYDHVISSDLSYWLNYVGVAEDEFWGIADTFRDPRVWRIESGEWVKDNVWGGSSSFGPVRLTQEQIKLFNDKQSKLNV